MHHVVDITQKRRAQHALRGSEAQLLALNETLEAQVAERTAERDGAWRLSQDLLAAAKPDGTLAAVNKAWTVTLGWQESQLVGATFMDFTHPDDLAPTLATFRTILDTPLTEPYEYRLRHRDGTYCSIAWTAAFENGHVFANGRDRTSEKKREHELAQAQEALRQSQKMEGIGQLTGGVAHDFNTLLTPIIGSLNMLTRRDIGTERERRLIDGALQSAERAKTLVQRLLSFARRQPLQPVAVDVAALVSGMADLVASTAGPTIEVRVALAANLPPANADANQLEMAILNLCVNARDAMLDGGTLTIGAAPVDVRDPQPSGLRPGHYVRLSIGDTGVGMDAQTLARAIKPFFSTKGIGKGTGLGLSMVHGLVAQLGGALTVDSVLGRGTTIELWLPVSLSTPEAGARSAAAAMKSRGCALLVDDEELIRMGTADMLGDIGFDVIEADSAERALRLVNEGAAFDLLITDHLMPGMNGVNLARAVRMVKPDVPVLIVSGYAELEGIAQDLPRLTKSFRQFELVEKLAEFNERLGQ